jgi:hypothetical protein
MKRVTGGRWRMIVLGHVLAEQVVGVAEVARARVRVSGRRSSGSFGSGRTAGYAIGEGTHITLAGGHCRDPRTTVSQAGLQARAGPRTRPEVRCGFRHGFSPAVPATQASTPSLPSAKKGWGKPLPSQKVCAGQSSVRGNPVCGAIQCAGKMCGAVL